MTGTTVINDVTERLRQERQRLAAERDQVVAQARQLADEIGRLERALRALEADKKAAAPRKTRKAGRTTATAADVTTLLEAVNGNEFTQATLREATGWGEHKARAVIGFARATGAVRLTRYGPRATANFQAI